MSNALKEYLGLCQYRVERALEARLPSETILPQKLHQAMRYCVLDGGKRMRPLLTSRRRASTWATCRPVASWPSAGRWWPAAWPAGWVDNVPVRTFLTVGDGFQNFTGMVNLSADGVLTVNRKKIERAGLQFPSALFEEYKNSGVRVNIIER